MRPGLISIWFFVGMLLLVYGVLIFGAGLYERVSLPAHPVVLTGWHAGIWRGLLLIAPDRLFLSFFPVET